MDIHFRQDKKHVSRPAVRIAILGISIGMMVMLLSLAIVTGFKQEIRNKTIGFGGHIQLTNFESNNSYELSPISLNDTLWRELASIPGVKHIRTFTTKPGIIKTAIFRVVLVLIKFWLKFFQSNLIDGISCIETDSLK